MCTRGYKKSPKNGPPLKGQYNEIGNNVGNLGNELSSLKSKVNQIEDIQTTQLNIFGDIATKNDLANLFSQVTNMKYDTPPSCFPNANYGTYHIDWVYSSEGDVWFAKHYADTPPTGHNRGASYMGKMLRQIRYICRRKISTLSQRNEAYGLRNASTSSGMGPSVEKHVK